MGGSCDITKELDLNKNCNAKLRKGATFRKEIVVLKKYYTDD